MDRSYDYILDIKNCISSISVWNFMKGKQYHKLEKSNFEDSHIPLPRSKIGIARMDFRLENNFLELVLRLMVFFKLDGKIGLIPLGSGKKDYAQDVRYILREIEILQPNIKNFYELKSKTIDSIIEKYYTEDNIKEISRGYLKLQKLMEFSRYGNDFLPLFLQFDTSIILNAKSFKKFKNDYRKEGKAKSINTSSRKPYDLAMLKILVGYSIEYLEKNFEDCILATKIYMDLKNNHLKGSNRHIHAYNVIKNNEYIFSEPTLKKLQENIFSSRSVYENVKSKKKGLPLNRIIISLIDSSKRIEACCIVIILITTGMRKSEAISLPRYPKIINDEYSNLKRIVYKTAKTAEGIELIMPIPKVTEKAIDVLSRISEIKDGNIHGNLINGSIDGNIYGDPSHRIESLINKISSDIGIKEPPLPHQFRHAIAFLIASINQKDGLELARLFLGHTSISMTLQYMGHYNSLIKHAINELHTQNSTHLVEQIVNDIKDGKKLYGRKGERLTANYQFKGSYADKFTDLLNISLLDLIKKGKLAIIQTPVSLCMHDLSKPEEMACQRGFNIQNFIGENPKPSRCEGATCSNAIFTESHIDKLQIGVIDKKLKERLEKNTFFIESGGFDNDPYVKIISKYENDKKLREVL